jgi:hypothetical protein
MSTRQLAKQHGYELAPTGKSSGMPFGFMGFDEPFELWPRKQLQKLTENTAYSMQEGASW